jgi:hypothetical protein
MCFSQLLLKAGDLFTNGDHVGMEICIGDLKCSQPATCCLKLLADCLN